MRYQPLSRRLINLIYPLVIYMAIGMAVLGLYPNGGLMANLIEKVSCIIIMGILFYKRFQTDSLGRQEAVTLFCNHHDYYWNMCLYWR